MRKGDGEVAQLSAWYVWLWVRTVPYRTCAVKVHEAGLVARTRLIVAAPFGTIIDKELVRVMAT